VLLSNGISRLLLLSIGTFFIGRKTSILYNRWGESNLACHPVTSAIVCIDWLPLRASRRQSCSGVLGVAPSLTQSSDATPLTTLLQSLLARHRRVWLPCHRLSGGANLTTLFRLLRLLCHVFRFLGSEARLLFFLAKLGRQLNTL
jgi:hypothetical protein